MSKDYEAIFQACDKEAAEEATFLDDNLRDCCHVLFAQACYLSRCTNPIKCTQHFDLKCCEAHSFIQTFRDCEAILTSSEAKLNFWTVLTIRVEQ